MQRKHLGGCDVKQLESTRVKFMHRKHVDVSRNLTREEKKSPKKKLENNISSECHGTDGKWGEGKIEQYIVYPPITE